MVVRVESWLWIKASTGLEPTGINWNSQTTRIFKDRLNLCVSLTTSDLDNAGILWEKLASFMGLHMHLA